MRTARPRLVLVASLWTLEGHPRPSRPWSLARKLHAIAEAGFAGVTSTSAAEPGLAPLLQRHRLRYTGHLLLRGRVDLRRRLAAERGAGAALVNLQLGDHATPPDEALELLLRVREEARAQGLGFSLETHRNTATDTPEKTLALAEAYRAAAGEPLPLTWDPSHWAVVKHLRPARFREMLLEPAELIRNSRLFHCRPFNGQHAQLPATDARGRPTPEFRAWLGYTEALFALWLRGPRPGGELRVCPEYGPADAQGYHLSTMPCPWSQAVTCRRELARLWRRLGGVC